MMRKHRLLKGSLNFLWLTLCIFLFSVSIAYAGVNEGTNEGDSWTAINTGLTDLDIQNLVIDPLNPIILYARAEDGVFKTTNGGDSWMAVNTGLTDLTIYSLAIDPTTPTTIYA